MTRRSGIWTLRGGATGTPKGQADEPNRRADEANPYKEWHMRRAFVSGGALPRRRRPRAGTRAGGGREATTEVRT
jgi:hypothetical protein